MYVLRIIEKFLMITLLILKPWRQEFTVCLKKELFLEYTTEMKVHQ